MRRKIYIASSWRNIDQPYYVKWLREEGHEVYDFRRPPGGQTGFAWDEIDLNWQKWTWHEYVRALGHPAAERGYRNDMDGMVWADTCLLLLPCGRSAHLEAGWMKGRGKDLVVLTSTGEEPELMAKMADLITGAHGPLLEFLNGES